MDDISKVIGSDARTKLLRLFYFNPELFFSFEECVTRSRISEREARRELRELVASKAARKKVSKGRVHYMANTRFRHYDALAAFMRDTTDIRDADIIERFKRAGTIKVITLSGLFTGALEGQVDIVIAGDNLRERIVANAIHTLEAELGRELRYATFATEDFRYRMSIYDRLLRDVYDYVHRTILDKTGITDR